MVQVRRICRSPAAQAGRRRRNSPPERSNPLSGENLIYQVRELRRDPLRSCAVPVGSRNFVPRPLAVEPPTGGKNMRASRPQTPRQVRITCTSANWFAVFKSFIGISKLWISEKIKFFSICHLHFSIFCSNFNFVIITDYKITKAQTPEITNNKRVVK